MSSLCTLRSHRESFGIYLSKTALGSHGELVGVSPCSGSIAGSLREARYRDEFWDLLLRTGLGSARRFGASTDSVDDPQRRVLEVTESNAVPRPDCELLDWAASGLMDLSGWPNRPPVSPPSPVIGRIRGVMSVLSALGEAVGRRPQVDVYALVAGRAGSASLQRGGRRSAGGTCRLVAAADGWLAVNLARAEDVELLGAALGRARVDRPWEDLESWAAARSASEAVGRLQLLGLPCATLPRGEAPSAEEEDRALGSGRPLPFRSYRIGHSETALGRTPTVVNLSSLWAGPLCGYLLAACGARVINVESSRRPDGLRKGSPQFFDFLHQYDELVTLDLPSTSGVEELRTLLRHADVVVEGSRPRALAQMGIEVQQLGNERPGLTWVSITGHGRRGAAANLVGLGDDAAAGGGLVGRDEDGTPVFCGDALADPLAGLYAAAAGLASIITGGGHLVEVAMSSVAAHVATGNGPSWDDHVLVANGSGSWSVGCGSWSQPVVRPLVPRPTTRSQPRRCKAGVADGTNPENWKEVVESDRVVRSSGGHWGRNGT